MNKIHDSYCYYKDICDHDTMCQDYTPVGEQAIDDAIDDMIESNRIAFRAEWFEYIESFED